MEFICLYHCSASFRAAHTWSSTGCITFQHLSGLFLPGIRLYYLLFSLLLSCSCQPVSRNTKFCETRSSFSRNTKLVSHEILENFVRKKFEYQPYYNLYFIFSYNLIRGISSCCSNQCFVSGRTFFLESGSDPDP